MKTPTPSANSYASSSLPDQRVTVAIGRTPAGFDDELRRWLCREAMYDGRTSMPDALAAATRLSRQNVRPGADGTGRYLSALMTAGLVDATLARVIEPHLDAHAILHQASMPSSIPEIAADADSTWGVYAANSAAHRLEAHRGSTGWTLSGRKPWCSLAETVSHAIITAEVPGAGSRAFAVRLDPDRVETLPGQWVSRGLRDVVSTGIHLDRVAAVPVGGTHWYLTRPGFSWGAIGVAAVWFGIATGVFDRVKQAADHGQTDQIALAQIGAADHDLFAAQVCLQHAADEIDADRAVGSAGELLSLRVRAVVARAAENMLAIAGRALGPGPMTSDEQYARRIADLGVYLRQHHGERDMVRLGKYRCEVED